MRMAKRRLQWLGRRPSNLLVNLDLAIPAVLAITTGRRADRAVAVTSVAEEGVVVEEAVVVVVVAAVAAMVVAVVDAVTGAVVEVAEAAAGRARRLRIGRGQPWGRGRSSTRLLLSNESRPQNPEGVFISRKRGCRLKG